MWGSLFLFVFFLSLGLSGAAVLLMHRLAAGRGDHAFFPRLGELVTAEEEGLVDWSLPGRLRLPPGTEAEIGWDGWPCAGRRSGQKGAGFRGKRVSVSLPLEEGASEGTAPAVMPPRGTYQQGTVFLVVRDWFGIFRWRLRLGESRTWYAAPRRRALNRQVRNMRMGGERRRPDGPPRRSQELLEVRPYFPGDDPRRLHWKLMAHLGDLFLRVGEDEPPPRSRWTVVTDSSLVKVPEGGQPLVLDRLAETVRALVDEGLGRGVDVSLYLPGDVSFQPGEGDAWLKGLAALERAEEPPRQVPRQSLLITSPWSRLGLEERRSEMPETVFVVNPWAEREAPVSLRRQPLRRMGQICCLPTGADSGVAGGVRGRGRVQGPQYRRESEQALDQWRRRGCRAYLLA